MSTSMKTHGATASRPSRAAAAFTLALALLCASGAAAGDTVSRTRGTGLFVGAALSAAWLNEEGHAPPLCCSERAEWTAWGPDVSLRGGVQLGHWVRITAEAGWAYQASTGSDYYYDVSFNMISGQLGLGLTVQLEPLPLTIRPALGVSLSRALGHGVWKGGAPSQTSDVDAKLFGTWFRLGLDYRLTDALDLGLEVTLGKIWIEQNVGKLSLLAVYHLPL